MRDIGPAFAGRNGKSKTPAQQSEHAARRVADRIDRRSGAKSFQPASVEHDPPKRLGREAEPAFPRNRIVRLNACGHGLPEGSCAAEFDHLWACQPRDRATRNNFARIFYRLTADGQSEFEIQLGGSALGSCAAHDQGRSEAAVVPPLGTLRDKSKVNMRNSTSLLWRQVIAGSLIALGLVGAMANIG